MATLRDIRRRIASVKSTQKITKAMKMVAAAKLRRAQDAIISARPYARKLRETLDHLSAIVDVSGFPHFAERTPGRVAIIVVSADRGLSGAFNGNIIRATVHRINETYADLAAKDRIDLYIVGRKAADFFGKRKYRVAQKYVGIFSHLQFPVAQAIAAEVTGAFIAGTYDKVEIIFNEFRSVVSQHVAIEQMLPLAPLSTDESTAKHAHGDYIYEPSDMELMKAFIPKQLDFQIWRVLLESNAAEQGAKMTAMDNATNNATDILRTLQLSYNKARQASITKELLEIVAGAEALRQAG